MSARCCWEEPQQSSAKPVDLQRLVEVDKCRTTHPKPHSGLDEPWYVWAWPLCTYLWHFKYFPQYPLRKRQWRYIQTMSTCWMNEQLCCFMPRTAPVLNELKKKKKADPEDSEMGLAEVLTCGFEQWSYLVRNTNVYSVALFTIQKKKKGKHIKNLKMTNG